MSWSDVVGLMRSDVERLGDDPRHSWRLVLRLYASLDSLSHKLASTLDVSPREMSALFAIWDGGRCTMSELAERVDLSRAAVTTMADRLEAGGLVKRVPDPGDRRRVLLTITERYDQQLQLAFAPLTSELDELADSSDWRVFAQAAAGVRNAARSAVDDIVIAPRKERDGDSPRAKPGPKPKPTYW